MAEQKRSVGRPAGSKNNLKNGIMAALRARYGKDFDPVMKIAENAMALDEISKDAVKMLEKFKEAEIHTLEDAKALTAIVEQVRPALNDSVAAFDKLAVYCKPKLKAIAIDGNLDVKTLVKIIDLSGEAPALSLEDAKKVDELGKMANQKIVVKQPVS